MENISKEPSSEPYRRQIIYGAGGHARELAFQLKQAGHDVVAFVDDISPSGSADHLPILSFSEADQAFRDAEWHIAIGNISAKRRLAAKIIKNNNYLGSFVSPNAIVSGSAQIMAPAQIFANTVVSANTRIEPFAVLHFGTIVAHDVTVGEFSFLAPRTTVAGHVIIGRDCWLGVGCTIINGSSEAQILIGNGATVGAGACVVKDVRAGDTVAGVPARPLMSRTIEQ
ncbi:NeuD/PglB/VioB family sugar acetyltransferase [Aureimonas frigidaquae]|uniref:Pilin glycosylation protein n=1 Tax=Aureimonas frigidaquae TaxID=424757 RepID=A0A0P0Z2A1_9HYPH|nr:NeuD/PglB/VioB family sugar acetyltransferase [Aureimonas frigidaquae]BAT28000.1 pilin glycosylation protein [Aureimonas frigidaquae]